MKRIINFFFALILSSGLFLSAGPGRGDLQPGCTDAAIGSI